MNDSKLVDALIEETNPDPDSVAVEGHIHAIHEICDRRRWPAAALCIVKRNETRCTALGTINLDKNDETLSMMASAGERGLELAIIIKILNGD